MNDIGGRLRWLRTQQGMTLDEAAEASAYSVPQIKKIESGQSPSLACLNALLEAYQTSLGEFFQNVPRAESKEEKMLFEELRFILDEGKRADADRKQQKRAEAIGENIHEFYQNALRHATPGGRVTKRQKTDRTASSAKKHGKYIDMIEGQRKNA